MSDSVARLSTALAGRYVIERELGQGGMATVYLTADLKHHRKVAVKVLRPEFAAALGQDRFLQEIEILSHLTHPHILPLHDSGVVDDVCFFVMPYLEGESLRDRLDREGQLPVEEAVQIAREIADALAYAHAHGVVHRDIKPHNIMLESGHAVLTDFGIALALDAVTRERLTETGFSPGTPHYMSPEQSNAARRLDGRSDIYSLGCVLYEMLAGDPPFTGPNLYAITARHAVEPPPSIRTVRPTVSESLERATFRALAKVPADRFRTATEFVHALTEVAHERVRETGPPRPTIPSGKAITAGPLVGRQDRSDVGTAGQVRLSVALRVITGVLIAVGLLTVVGFMTIVAFDTKLQVPPQFTPSQPAFPVVGAKALFPSVFYSAVAAIAFLLLRGVLRVMLAVLDRLPRFGSPVREAHRRWTNRGRQFWKSADPSTVCDLFMMGSVLLSVAVIVVFWELLVPLFTWKVNALTCANRDFHRPFQPIMTGLIAGIALGRLRLLQWLTWRGVEPRSYVATRWGTLALIFVLTITMTVPWRLMWSGNNERVLLGNDRAYIVLETDKELVLYDAVRRTSTAVLKERPDLIRLWIPGYVFEEAEVFHSGVRECESVTVPRSTQEREL